APAGPELGRPRPIMGGGSGNRNRANVGFGPRRPRDPDLDHPVPHSRLDALDHGPRRQRDDPPKRPTTRFVVEPSSLSVETRWSALAADLQHAPAQDPDLYRLASHPRQVEADPR